MVCDASSTFARYHYGTVKGSSTRTDWHEAYTESRHNPRRNVPVELPSLAAARLFAP
jgi:hypothetical protein